MANREQRREKLRNLSKKFTGINVERETLEIPIKNSDEKLEVDLTNFDTFYNLSEMCEVFSDMKTRFSDDYKAADELESEVKALQAQLSTVDADISALGDTSDDSEAKKLLESRDMLNMQLNESLRTLNKTLMRVYMKVVKDFRERVDAVFGDDATRKVFGNNSPMPNAIAQFIQELAPVVEALSYALDVGPSGVGAPSAIQMADRAALRSGNA